MISITCLGTFSTIILFSLCCFSQSQSIVGASKDNTLFEDSTGSLSNGAGANFYVGKNNQGFLRRGVIAFDLRGNIPDGALIDSVSLTLFMSQTTSGPQSIGLHKIASDWGEGTSNSSGGQGAPATQGDATWLHTFYDSSFWGAQGGDFLSQASAEDTVDTPAFYTWESTSELILDVQNWLDNPSSNFGWLAIGEEITNQTTKRFETRENPIPANRPTLTVFWSNPSSIDLLTNPLLARDELYQNYPNPFNPETHISYALRGTRFVRLEVHNLLGERIAVLVNENQSPGVKTVVWRGMTEGGTPVPTGVYFYQINTGDVVRVGRMIIAK